MWNPNTFKRTCMFSGLSKSLGQQNKSEKKVSNNIIYCNCNIPDCMGYNDFYEIRDYNDFNFGKYTGNKENT